MRSIPLTNTLLVASLMAFCISPLVAQQSNAPRRGTSDPTYEFYRAFYLHHEKNDLKEAQESYQRALELGAGDVLKEVIEENQTALQEDLSAADFAKLMPADSMAYLEISRPGHHLEEIAHMMGLTGKSFDPDYKPVQIDLDGLTISSDFQISPSLLREMKKFRGAAVSVSNIDRTGKPLGVAIIHPGDSDLLTGLVETGIQLVPSAERIGGFPTFQIENEAWIVKTNRLIVASTQKAMIKDCLARLSGGSNSLSENEAFVAARTEHGESALFAYVDPKTVFKKLGPMMGNEAAIAKVVLDVNHMNYMAASIRSTENGTRTRINTSLQEGHNSLAYGLIRTVPLTKQALSHIPTESAVVAGLGLNPKLMMAAEAAGDGHITALDIGRELFANIEEVGAFVMPQLTEANSEIPEFGIVLVANNADKSEALWHQLLSLPEQLEFEDGPSSKEFRSGAIKGRQYSFNEPGIPNLVVARLDDSTMIAGTSVAVKSAIAAQSTGKTFANSESAQPLWQSTSDQTAKAIFVHAARTIQLAAQFENGPERRMMEMIGQAAGDFSATLVSNESSTNFELRLDLMHLPQFEAILKTAAQMNQGNRIVYERRATPVQAAEKVRSTGE